MVEVVVPVVRRPTAAPSQFAPSIAPPPEPTLGLIDNSKARARQLLNATADVLRASGAVGDRALLTKLSAAKPISTDERSELLARAHVVISGVGD